VRNDLSTTQLNVEYHFTDLFEMLKPILDGLLHYGLDGINVQ